MIKRIKFLFLSLRLRKELNKKKSKGKIIKPIGNIKKGGNKSEDNKPQIKNWTKTKYR